MTTLPAPRTTPLAWCRVIKLWVTSGQCPYCRKQHEAVNAEAK